MDTLDGHPRTGRHYVIVVSAETGPFSDIWAMYSNATKSRPWLRCIEPREALDWRTMSFYQNPQVVMVIFEPTKFDPWPKASRKATVAAVYSEALGGQMLDAHVKHLERFEQLVHRYDVVLAHAHGAQVLLQRYFGSRTRVELFPVGWCPLTMGAPDFTTPRHELIFLGSELPRRTEIINELCQAIHIDWPRALYGRAAVDAIARAKGYLYVAHSLCDTFSTWRMWQALAAGTPLVAERASSEHTWPFIPDHHFIALKDIRSVGEIKDRMLANDVTKIAKRALADLGEAFCIDRVIEDWLVPLGDP